MNKRCVDCNTILKDYRSTRCKKCAGKIKSGRNYPKCIDCGKTLSNYHSHRCRKCFQKSRHGHIVLPQTREKIADTLTGKSLSVEHKKNIGKAIKGYKHSETSKHNMSNGAKKREERIRTEEHINNLHAANLNNGHYLAIGEIRTHKGNQYIKIAHRQGQRNWYPYHRYLMEEKIGRKLDRNEHVHHIDGNKSNNELSNLLLVTASQHNKLNYFLGLLSTASPEVREGIVKTIRSRIPELN